MPDIALAFLAVVLLVAAYVPKRVLKRRGAMLQQHSRFRDDFYRYAQPLLEDDDTPVVVLKILRFMNLQLSRKSSARSFLASILRRRTISNYTSDDFREMDVINEFIRKRPELAKSFNRACASGLLAISYRSVVFGWIVRKLILFDIIQDNDRAERIVAEFAIAQPC
jgi:hypothetical protein